MVAEVGSPAPEFTLTDQNGDEISLGSLRGRKTLVVFIPFPFSRTCEAELCTIRDNLGVLNEVDAAVVVITCDTRHVHRAWAEHQGFTFPILSDYWPHGAVARAYGCFDDRFGCATRATYVLDADGVVRRIITTDSLGTARDFGGYPEALASA